MGELPVGMLVFSFILLALSSAVIFYFFSLLARNLFGDTRGFFERLALRKKEKMLAALEKHPLDQADAVLPVLRAVLHLSAVRRDPALPAKIERHHILLLQKIILLAEKKGSALRHLDTLESLIVERQPLLRAFMEAQAALLAFRKTRRHTPEWAHSEYENRVSETAERLEEHSGALKKALDQVLSQLEAGKETGEITYH